MSKDLSEIIPIQNIEKQMLINGNGDITAGFSILMPEVFTYDNKEANYLLSEFDNLFTSVPTGTYFQFQNFIYTDKYKSDSKNANLFTQIEDLKHFDNRPLAKQYLNLYVTLPTFGNKKQNSFITHSDYIFKKPFKNVERETAKAIDTFKIISDILQNNESIEFFRMDNEALGSAIYDYYNLSYDKPSKDFKAKSLEPFKIEQDLVKVGGEYANVISLVAEGISITNFKEPDASNPKDNEDIKLDYDNKIKIPTCLTYPIGIGLPFNHILNLGVEILDKEDAVRSVNKDNIWLSILQATKNKDAFNKKRDVDTYTDLLSTHKKTPVKVSLNVIVNDKDANVVKQRANLVKQLMKKMNGSTGWVENRENANLFFSSFPGNMRTNIRNFFSISQFAAMYVHTVNYYYNDEQGVVYPDRFGNPTVINFKDNDYKTNNNGIVVGTTGSGKSHVLQGLIDKFLNAGDDVLLINVKPDYINSGKVNGCNYIDTNDINGISLAPFITSIDKDGYYTIDNHEVQYLKSLILDCWAKEPSEEVNALLDNYLIEYYGYVNENRLTPSFTGFYDYNPTYYDGLKEENKKYIDIDSFRLVLETFARGKYSNLLNSTKKETIIDIQYTVFDFFGIIKDDPKIFKIYLNYAVYIGVQKIYANMKANKFTWIIIDEAVDSMKGKAANFIGEQMRKIRSLNGGIWLATQGITYFDQVDPLVRDSIFECTDYRILLKPKENSIKNNKLIQEYLSISDFGIELQKSLTFTNTYREWALFIGSSYKKVFRNEVSDKTNIVYQTSTKKGSDAVLIQEEFAKWRNPGMAVNNYYEKKKQLVS
jgi:hypothetical protein